MGMILNTKTFIKLANQQHKGIYTVDRCIHLNVRTNVTIMYKIHDNFPRRHG